MSEQRQPTHGGGVVYRIRRGSPEFLLVTARRKPQEWVFPKGHIEPGETAERAAVREVEEEAGVRAAIVQPLEDVELDIGAQHQVTRYFLMTAMDDGSAREGRQSRWLPPGEALQSLSFPQSRKSLERALEALARREEL